MAELVHHMLGLYWAKSPELDGLPPLAEVLQKAGLTAAEAVWLREQYAEALAGGARAAKVLAVSGSLLTPVLEQFDGVPSHNLLSALKEALGIGGSGDQPAASLALPAPHHVNGLVVWLLDHPSGRGQKEAVMSSYAEICKSGGSPAKVEKIAAVAADMGLVTTDGEHLALTERGKLYGLGGPSQGSALWEMTETRRLLLLNYWEEHTGETPVLRALEAYLNQLVAGAATTLDLPERWLRELKVRTENGYLAVEGVRVLRKIAMKPPSAAVAPEAVLTEFLQHVTAMTGDLKLDMARLRDEVRAVAQHRQAAGTTVAPQPKPGAGTGETRLQISLDDVLNMPVQAVPDELLYLKECAARLRQSGYQVQDDEVINLYICTRAGRLTVLAGPPGVGKSSVVRKFASALGHQSTIKEISVRRGWTDDLQFLGAVNRLHQRYDPAPTGVVQHLLKADLDREYGLYFVLLDEFNLSVPEYYFAEFISVLESDAPAVRLYPEGMGLTNEADFPDTVPINPTVHFFGTINLDETGFPLSPRLLDRTNFVWVERKVGLEVLDAAGPLPPATIGPISGQEYAARRKPPQISGTARAALKKVIDCLAQEKKELGPAHITSPRALLGAASYVANSQGLLPETDALDYAVVQRILPGLRGLGEPIGKRMSALAGVLQELGLKRSQRLLKRMTDAGSQHGEYNFVASLW